MMPVGVNTLGRIFSVLGDVIDNGAAGSLPTRHAARSTPMLPSLKTCRLKTTIFETGIKVVDLLTPYPKGGKIGLFGGAGVGKTVTMMELINNVAKRTVVTRCSPVWVSVPVKVTTCGTK